MINRKDPNSSTRSSIGFGRNDMGGLLDRCGISLSPAQLDQLWTYHQLLREHNQELNLTRIHNFVNMVLKLYVDSIFPGKLIDLPSPLMDLGTGPGMPGIPLKIAYPHLELLLAESRRKRVEFLRKVSERLSLEQLTVIGEGITPRSEYPVSGVITRAVESIALTLTRIRGILAANGLAIFMKGPRCEEEVEDAVRKYSGRYELVQNIAYKIPHTPHERRLVVFRRLDEPIWARRGSAMKRHTHRLIDSEHNDIYKDLKKLLASRGIKKLQKALVSGAKVVSEVLRDFPEQCEAWISSSEEFPPPASAPKHLAWYQLAPPLFQVLDMLGTKAPILLIRTREIPVWRHLDGFPEGCTVLIPFQDPENVGTVIRSAAAFGAVRIILLAESAHPYHPKAFKASGGTVLRSELWQGPSLRDLPEDLPVAPLSAEGKDISTITFPRSFAFLPGMEGPGLPALWRKNAIAIPMSAGVESLNAATATAIALYVWSKAAS